MFTLRKLSVAIAASAVAVLGIPATAAVAADTPGYVCVASDIVLTVAPSSVVGGNTVTISAHAQSGNTEPAGDFTVTFLGNTYHSNGAFSQTVSTPVVTKTQVKPVKASFVPNKSCDNNGNFTDSTVSTTAPASSTAVTSVSYSHRVLRAANSGPGTYYLDPAPATKNVTIRPAGSGDDGNGDNNGDNNGALPNTGGTNLWYLLVGAALLGLGVAIVGTVSSRRTKKFI